MQIVELCKALADETRVRIANLLLHHELNVGEIVSILEMGQPRVSRHLKILSDSNLVQFRRDGLWIFYSANEDGIPSSFLRRLESFFKESEQLATDLHKAERIIEDRTQATKQFFDSIASEWEQMKQEVLGNYDLAVEILDIMPECNVAVDIGCGPGELLSSLAKRAFSTIGVDNSNRMLEIAAMRTANLERVSLRTGELTRLPLKKHEANFGVISLALHHVASPQKALQEAHRVLVPSGKLVVAEFDRHTNERMRTQFGDRWLGFSEEELTGWLTQAGFRVRSTFATPVKQGLKILMYDAIKKN